MKNKNKINITSERKIRKETLKRLTDKLGKNIKVLDIESSTNKNRSDYKVKLKDIDNDVVVVRNYTSIIYRKNKLTSLGNKCDDSFENVKISDLIKNKINDISKDNPTKQIIETSSKDDVVQQKLDQMFLMISELSEKISNLSVNVSFSK